MSVAVDSTNGDDEFKNMIVGEGNVNSPFLLAFVTSHNRSVSVARHCD